jgi:hypothetical protein
MSSRSRKARETIAPQEASYERVRLDSFAPDHGTRCEVCGRSPCVTGLQSGQVVYQSRMCGPHTFGTAAASDPDNW